MHKGKATVLGACSGAVAGLVAITPAAGFVTPMGAMTLGLLVSFVCYGAILMKGKLGYDDSLDVFGVHGVGGMFGALGVGFLAAKRHQRQSRRPARRQPRPARQPGDLGRRGGDVSASSSASSC